MELKAMKEYKSPEYSTANESKNKALMMMVRTGKISLGVAVMCLLCNSSLAQSIVHLPDAKHLFVQRKELEHAYDIQGPPISFWVLVMKCVYDIYMLGIIIWLVVTVAIAIKIHKRYKICEDAEEKTTLYKKRNNIVIKNSIIIVALILIPHIIIWSIDLVTRLY